jgi:hypothetical protein
MQFLRPFFLLCLCVSALVVCGKTFAQDALKCIPGQLYHGVAPSGEGDLAEKDLKDYLKAIAIDGYAPKSEVAWVYFVADVSKQFPTETCKLISTKYKAIPYIHLTLTIGEKSEAKKNITLADLNQDPKKPSLPMDVQTKLQEWIKGAEKYRDPVLVEWGPECNSKESPWNADYNGKLGARPSDAAQLFAATYRNIIAAVDQKGKVFWVFHLNVPDNPTEEWNRFEEYFPGDGVSFIGMTVFGLHQAGQKDIASFYDQFDCCYRRIKKNPSMAKLPIILSKVGCAKTGDPTCARWTEDAFRAITMNKNWDNLCGLSWWNYSWKEKDTIIDMKVADNSMVADIVRRYLSAYPSLHRPRVFVP